MNRTYLRRAEWTTRQRIRHGAETAVVAARPELVQLLRENQRLLRELTAGYRMPRVLQRDARWASAEPPVIACPHDIVTLLGDEMSTLCTEQLRVVLLDAKNHVVGCDVLYQGTVHSITVRAAEVLRPA